MELAVVAPLFFFIILAMIEFGRMITVQQVLTNASRVGARRAVVEGATQSEVATHVSNYLKNSSLTGTSVTVSPTNLTNLGFGDTVTVTISVPFSKVSWTPTPWFLGGATLKASTLMQAERLQ